MTNPPKQKGTAGETELKNLLNERGFKVRRTSPTLPYDLIQEEGGAPVEVLATRPDRGQWLVTLKLQDFIDAFVDRRPTLHIEVKRYSRFSLHTIFEGKFGRGK